MLVQALQLLRGSNRRQNLMAPNGRIIAGSCSQRFRSVANQIRQIIIIAIATVAVPVVQDHFDALVVNRLHLLE